MSRRPAAVSLTAALDAPPVWRDAPHSAFPATPEPLTTRAPNPEPWPLNELDLDLPIGRDRGQQATHWHQARPVTVGPQPIARGRHGCCSALRVDQRNTDNRRYRRDRQRLPCGIAPVTQHQFEAAGKKYLADPPLDRRDRGAQVTFQQAILQGL